MNVIDMVLSKNLMIKRDSPQITGTRNFHSLCSTPSNSDVGQDLTAIRSNSSSSFTNTAPTNNSSIFKASHEKELTTTFSVEKSPYYPVVKINKTVLVSTKSPSTNFVTTTSNVSNELFHTYLQQLLQNAATSELLSAPVHQADGNGDS